MSQSFTSMWEFIVMPGSEEAFIRLYGSEGKWAGLFRQAGGYLRTELYRDASDPRRFVTVDYWDSESAYERFRADFAADFADLDRAGEELTESERCLGHFTPVI